jgi:acid phosphatase type 7
VFDAGAAEPIRPRAIRDRVERETAPATTRYTIAAAGDIACDHAAYGKRTPSLCQYDDTAHLIDGDGLAAVLLLGDDQYERGAYAEYRAYFDPTWGRAFDNLAPAPGNHEYDNDPSSRPKGYFRYFGESAKGPDGLGYYAFDVGACPGAPCWHVISLNSELCFAAGGCGPATDPSNPGPGNRMYAWLEQDLAAHPDADYPCTLAYWHHPRFSFSTGSGASIAVAPLWQLLHAASADVVLNGHSHNYQRWQPQDPKGTLDQDAGIREFVVGTGGASHYAIPAGTRPANLAAAQANAFGVLRLSLRADGYRWRWVSARGQPGFDDASEGAVACVRASP